MHFRSERSFRWLLSQDIDSVKELARVIQAASVWNVRTDLFRKLADLRTGNCWDDNLRDTARAASALAAEDISFPEAGNWMLSLQKDGAWNNDVYDTTYVLTALADMGIHNREGCLWLVENYGPVWEHPGTTALIITALIKQGKLCENDRNFYEGFISERASWILSKRVEDGAWKTPATSNIVMQALTLAGHGSELGEAVQWMLEKMNPNGSWGKEGGDINTTALTLITLGSLGKT